MSYQVSIPANGTWQTQIVGAYNYCYIRAAAEPFQISYDAGQTWQTRYQNDQDKPVRKWHGIQFRAYLGVAVDVTFDVGDSQFTSSAAEVTGSVSSELANNIAANIAVVPLQFAKVGNVANAVALANAALYFRWCLLIAVKDLAGTANAGDVKIGFQGGANQQPITLATGDQYVLPIPIGAKVDFQNVWLKIGIAGDGVVALYV